MKSGQNAGMSMILVLFCLAIASILMMVQVRSLLNTKNVERHRVNEIQASSLSLSGVDRAIRQLELSPDYRGEVWECRADQIVGTSAGRVSIVVSTIDELKSVQVVAEYPLESTHRAKVRQMKQIPFNAIAP